MRLLVIGAAVLSLAMSGSAFAGSKCDAGITKAAGKKVACKDGVYAGAQAKGTTPDPTKLQKCTDKFTKACTKAQSAGDCVVHTQSCTGVEAQADACAVQLASPSGAFLN